MKAMISKPSAFIPVVMSLIALAMVLIHAATVGIVHEADEGTAAHVFQLLMAAQVPIVAFFAFRWLPRVPAPAAKILGLQVLAAVLACATVYFLT
jgi:hypothetical protein